MYFVNGNKDVEAHFAFFFKFLIFPSVTLTNTYGHFSSEFTQLRLNLGV